MPDLPDKLTREDIAKLEIGHTAIGRWAKWTLMLALLATITAEPAIQHVADLRAYFAGQRASPWPRCCSIFSQASRAVRLETDGGGPWGTGLWLRNARLEAALHRYEDSLEDDSLLSAAALGPVQQALAHFGAGNEQAYVGRDGWLFYRPDIDSLTGGSFLHPRHLAGREERAGEQTHRVQADPRPAILRFHEQLAARGIVLVVMPTPAKPTVHPEAFSSRYQPGQSVQNPAFEAFCRELQEQGVRVFDPASGLARAARQTGQPQYLKADTHWRPDAMQRVAADLAAIVRALGATATLPSSLFELRRTGLSQREETRQVSITALGDIARMLKLPTGQRMFLPETVALRQIVQADGSPWRPARAEVLLLGDSFTNVYSPGAMGWGESAGLAEQLSYELGSPLDRIARNDNGAFATREDLVAQLAADPGRLEGVKVVVWQFAARELAVGDWKLLDLPEPKAVQPPAEGFFVPARGATTLVEGTVAQVSPVPRPGTVAYRDHILVVRLSNLRTVDGAPSAGQAVVYSWSMRDNVQTAAARLAVGDRVRLRVQPWDDVADRYEAYNRSVPDDLPPEFTAYNWAEEIERR